MKALKPIACGEIDGKFGENAKKALRAYAEALQLAAIDKLTQEVWQRLTTDAMAAKQLDRLADKSAPAEEQVTRKRRLLKRAGAVSRGACRPTQGEGK